MFNKLIMRRTTHLILLRCLSINQVYRPLIYCRSARFGLFEDKLKEFKKEVFNRSNLPKDSSKGIADSFKTKFFRNSKESEYNLSSLPLDNCLVRVKSAVENKEESLELYFSLIERIKSICVDEPESVSKTDVLNILRTLSLYRPKEQERLLRDSRNQGYSSRNETPMSNKHKNALNNNGVSENPFTHVAQHFQENLNINNIKGMFKDYVQSMDDENAKTIYEVIEQYKILFLNLELYIQQYYERNDINHKEALEIIIAFSIAQEGTVSLIKNIANVVKIGLKNKNYTIFLKFDFNNSKLFLLNPLNLCTSSDISLLIKYNSSYQSQEFNAIEMWEETGINELILSQITNDIGNFTTKNMLLFFKAFTSASKIPKELFNKLLNKFVREIEMENISKEELISFLEIYGSMIDNMKGQLLDSKLLLSLISKHIGKMYKAKTYKFDLSELTKLYWVYGVLDVFSDSSCSELVKPLEMILNEILSVLIAEYKPISSESLNNEDKESRFSEKDLNAIKFYYQKYGENGCLSNSSQIIRIIETISIKYSEKKQNIRKSGFLYK